MEMVQHVLDLVASYFQTGFYQVNAVQGLIIAAVAAYMLSDWRRILFVTAGAVVVHAIFDVMIPVLGGHAAFRLPPLVEMEYWRHLLQLYAGYLIVISVLYVIKRVVLGGAGSHAH